MGNVSYPNRDWLQQQYDSRLTDAMDAIQHGVNTVGMKLGADPVGDTTPPPAPAALQMTAGDGVLQATIQDHTPIKWGVHYFLEYSTTPGFDQPHQIALGPTRSWRGSLGNQSLHWRAYSMYPGQTQESPKVYHRGAVTPGLPMAAGIISGGAGGGGGGGGGGGITAALTSFTSTVGNFTVAHGLGYAPSFVALSIAQSGSSLLGLVGWQSPTRFDATNFYLYASDTGILGYVDSIQ